MFLFVIIVVNGNHVLISSPTHVKDELFNHVDVIKRNVKNLLKIAKRDSWLCDRQPKLHGEMQFEFNQSYTIK